MPESMAERTTKLETQYEHILNEIAEVKSLVSARMDSLDIRIKALEDKFGYMWNERRIILNVISFLGVGGIISLIAALFLAFGT